VEKWAGHNKPNRTISQAVEASSEADSPLAKDGAGHLEPAPQNQHRLFLLTCYVVDLLLLVSIFAAFYTSAGEYFARRYLKGFSDAVIPAAVSPEEKIQAILDWMSHGPARLTSGFVAPAQDRDPTDTLNYDSLRSLPPETRAPSSN
jgi:hypothetical protein